MNKISYGDELFIGRTGCNYKVGEQFEDYPAVIVKVHKETIPWWMFWKKRKPYGYTVKWIGSGE